MKGSPAATPESEAGVVGILRRKAFYGDANFGVLRGVGEFPPGVLSSSFSVAQRSGVGPAFGCDVGGAPTANTLDEGFDVPSLGSRWRPDRVVRRCGALCRRPGLLLLAWCLLVARLLLACCLLVFCLFACLLACARLFVVACCSPESPAGRRCCVRRAWSLGAWRGYPTTEKVLHFRATAL